MAKAIRFAAYALIISLALGGSYLVFFSKGKSEHSEPVMDARLQKPIDNSSCAECHPEIFQQWESSMHKMAWDDPEVNLPNLSLKEKPDCWSCHVPEPVLVTGLTRLPQTRSARRSDGIDCISCHYTPDGMAGDAQDDSAPCKPSRDKRIRDIALCESCHNQHKTHDEWKKSPFFPQQDCNHCHMATVRGIATRGRPEREYRSHTFPGAHDPKMLAGAITLTLAVENGGMVVELANNRVGHGFPTDARHHLAQLQVDVVTASGERTAYILEESFQSGVMNRRQINPGEKRSYRMQLDSSEGFLRARLLYCLQPVAGAVSEKLEGANSVVIIERKVQITK